MIALHLLTADRVRVLDLLAQHAVLTPAQIITLGGGNAEIGSADYQRVLRVLRALRSMGLVTFDGCVYTINKGEVRKWQQRMSRWL
jgi:hypothetical protein